MFIVRLIGLGMVIVGGIVAVDTYGDPEELGRFGLSMLVLLVGLSIMFVKSK